VTFLFTDIEGSTRLWEQQPEAMRTALARHDALVRAAVDAHGGTIVKTTGDGAHAAFAAAADGVRAAIDAQRALRAESWPAEATIVARMGVHTGVAEERDGDYYGAAVNRAARIMAVGHGGQILISDAAAAVLRDERSIKLRDLGEHRLRDLSRPERVHQVVAEGLADDFAALRSLDALPTNLPSQLATFIGREAELNRVGKALAEHRLVTLTGVGGVGKTRLALQLAADVLPEFRDGAWVSELAPAGEAEAMLGIVATTFSVQQRVGSTLEESIAEVLRNRELLWIIDNCEHLIEPVARLVDRVLRVAPGVRILATSREGLDLDGEHITALRSLSLAASNDVDLIVNSDAVCLFEERARAVREDFRVDAANAATVDELCRRLDGIPLAIVLAASRVASLGVPEILALLDERFRLLTGGRRVALERHQTLRAAVDWSFSLLLPDEAVVFCRLAVFAGSFDARATRVIVDDEAVDEWAVLDAIDGLVRKSMVSAEEQPDGSVRYQMLETLRQYARERLEQDSRRHADYYVALSEEAGAGLKTPAEFAWRARLHLELDNLRAATQWAFDVEDVDLLKRVVFALAEEITMTSLSLGPLATRALSLADHLPRNEQGWLMANAALDAYNLSDPVHAAELSVESWARGIDPEQPTRALRFYVGSANMLQPNAVMRALIEVRRIWSEAALEAAGAGRAELAQMTWGFVNMALLLGEFELGREWADRGYELAQQSGNPTALAGGLLAIGQSRLADDPDGALRAFAECIDLARQGARAAGSGAALFLGALVYARRGERGRASSQLVESIEHLRLRGRSSELDAACAYAIEILSTLGLIDAAAVVLGSVLGGELRVLRDVPVPPDRQPVDVRAMRETLGKARFEELLAVGARMSYDEILDHIVAAADGA
jgi:predicted ATPase/class 3 adenylate cyclase